MFGLGLRLKTIVSSSQPGGPTLTRAMLQWMDKVRWPYDVASAEIRLTWLEYWCFPSAMILRCSFQPRP